MEWRGFGSLGSLSRSFVEGSRDEVISPKEVRMLLMGAGHPKNDN